MLKKNFRQEKERNVSAEGEPVIRVRLPRDNQTLGILDQRLGGNRMRVRCLDGKTRICRVPGRMKKRLWVREGDVLLVEPWELNKDSKGDVVFKYHPNQVAWLKKNGHLKGLENLEEF